VVVVEISDVPGTTVRFASLPLLYTLLLDGTRGQTTSP
jgi:hypothetical protein